MPNSSTPAPAASSRMICRADFDSPFWSISIWSGNLRCWGLAAVIRAFRTFMGGVGARERQPDCDLGLEQSHRRPFDVLPVRPRSRGFMGRSFAGDGGEGPVTSCHRGGGHGEVRYSIVQCLRGGVLPSFVATESGD